MHRANAAGLAALTQLAISYIGVHVLKHACTRLIPRTPGKHLSRSADHFTWQVLALGTSSGTVHLLDYEGNEAGNHTWICLRGQINQPLKELHAVLSTLRILPIDIADALSLPGLQVRQIAAHSAPIQGMSFDDTADHLATCADDGTVLVRWEMRGVPSVSLRMWVTCMCSIIKPYIARCCASTCRCPACTARRARRSGTGIRCALLP